MSKTFTITYCDQAENHVGMQKIGTKAYRGLNLNDLQYINIQFGGLGIIYNLKELLPYGTDADDAYILIVRNLINRWYKLNMLYNELMGLNYDKKAYMRGRVVNKRARWNLCIANYPQEPDYINKKGRVVAFNEVPYIKDIGLKIYNIIKHPIVAEINYYYNNSCYIGFHGDSERKLVFGVRVGASIPLYYQWYTQWKPVGNLLHINLNDGDLYVMSAKALGRDWRRPSILTLRHAAGNVY